MSSSFSNGSIMNPSKPRKACWFPNPRVDPILEYASGLLSPGSADISANLSPWAYPKK